MKNPLNKRYFRELKNDFGKYIALCDYSFCPHPYRTTDLLKDFLFQAYL